MINSLKNTKLFGGLHDDALHQIATFSKLITVMPDSPIIAEEQNNSTDLFLLTKGRVDVGKKFAPTDTSKTIPLSSLDEELFGEISWLTRRKRSAVVKCIELSNFLVIDGEKLRQYMESHPEVGYVVLSRIAELLSQRLINRTEELRYHGIRDIYRN
ncbi:MAG: cyclic nucleotide-binding domain-containing protein [Magnetococcales bacterium]|nr:cyclic nucleotide-binding domain-containing protein [Magnetococcales bacterium]